MKHFLWCFLLLFVLRGLAQKNDVEDQVSTASGNPYLFKDWMDGVVIFKSGRVVKQFKLRFDCVHNRLMLQFEGAAFAAESQIKEFVLYNTGGRKSKDSMVFRKGFPAVDKYSEETYYQVLFTGKVVLLRLPTKMVLTEKQLVGNNSRTSLMDEDFYYLLQEGVMTALPKDKDVLVNKLPVQLDGVKEFVVQQSLRMDKAADFVKVITRYNELLQ